MTGRDVEGAAEGHNADVGAGRPRRGRRSADALLGSAFGQPLPQLEAAMWAGLSARQRELALSRLETLLLFDSPESSPTPEKAAADHNLSLNRWYELHQAWRTVRSLASLGIAAAMPRSRNLSHHNDLQRLVVGVVESDPDGSVRRLALSLGQAFGEDTGLPPDDWPHYNTLRRFVEAETRRRSREVSPGNELVLDCCACLLPHSESTFVAFLAMDRGSRTILGAALGDAADSRAGYALAAQDALRRIGESPLADLSWVDRLERSQIVIGLDEGAWSGLDGEVAAAGLTKQLQPASSKRRFGMYVRRLLGDRVGRVRFLPGRTAKGHAGVASTVDDLRRLAVEVDHHNAAVVPDGDGRLWSAPPVGLVETLRFLVS